MYKDCGCSAKVESKENPADGITYVVKGNELIVKKGKSSQRITIYKECPFRLTEQFEILNLYLNNPLTNLPQMGIARNIPDGTNYTTKYKSSGLLKGCNFMTFETISPEDEAYRLSRVVSPKNELIQLYQGNFTYKVKYNICNRSKKNSKVTFIYADFSNDSDTEGASYVLRDTKGRHLGPYEVRDMKVGCFCVNGYNYPLLVHVKGDVKIKLTITGEAIEKYPPVDRLVLPINTKFGKVKVLVYTMVYNGRTSTRHVTNEFRGINALIRGNHQALPVFPCSRSTGIIISPPPYEHSAVRRTNYGVDPGDSVMLKANHGSYNIYGNILVTFLRGPDIEPSGSFVFLSNPVHGGYGYSFVNLKFDTNSRVRVDFEEIFASFKTPYPARREKGTHRIIELPPVATVESAPSMWSKTASSCGTSDELYDGSGHASHNIKISEDRKTLFSDPFSMYIPISASTGILSFYINPPFNTAINTPPLDVVTMKIKITYLGPGGC